MSRRWIIVLLLALSIGCSNDAPPTIKDDSVNDPAKEPQQDPGQGEKSSALAAAEASIKDMNKMKAVAVSMHNYLAATQKFPMVEPGNGRINSDLSWRVLVLAYLEHFAVYEKFDLSQPWNSAQNKPLISGPAEQVFSFEDGDLICAIKVEDPPATFSQIPDGASNTVALMGNPNASADQWSSPVDFTVEEAVQTIKSLKKGESILVALYDGSVRKVYSTEGSEVTDEEIAALFNPRDGTVINQRLFSPDQ